MSFTESFCYIHKLIQESVFGQPRGFGAAKNRFLNQLVYITGGRGCTLCIESALNRLDPIIRLMLH